jgi:hypothetical protein
MEIDFGTVHAVRTPASSRTAAAAALVARILLGLVFSASGASGFLFLFMSVPPQSGLAGAFTDLFFRSHWVQFVDGIELIAGILLLANRYVTLALVLLGAVIANILVFHVTMQPQTITVPIVVLGLWIFLAYRNRANLAPLFKK